MRINAPVLDIDPFDEDALKDPAPFQEMLRDAGEFVWLSRYGIWATGRFAQVHAVLSDWKVFRSSGGVGLANFHKEKPWRTPSLLLEHDPPEHTRARSVIMRALAAKTLRALRETFAREAVRSVERLLRLGRFDAIAELAEGYPLKVFGDAVGIAVQDRHKLLDYGSTSFNALGPRNALFMASMRDAEATSQWIMARCARSALDPNGLGAMMFAAADEGVVTEEEATLLVRSFLSAGVDTTVRALGGAIDSFARNPEQWQLLRADPTLAKAAAEEAIRHTSPFQTVFRTTTVAYQHNAGRIEPDEKILLSLAAANHDPREWDRPDAFELRREKFGHVGFGAGIHGCAGQALARMEIEVILQELARQVATIELDGEATLALNNTVRGFARLPVRLHA